MVEIIWDGKYDADGKRAAPLKVALPFQTVETINESSQQRMRSLFAQAAQESEWRNRLIWGDKKYVLPSLLPEFSGKVDLIYIDPPFATGDNFSYHLKLGDDSFTKQATIIEEKAYRDTWEKGLDSYLKWFHEALTLLNELLAPTGSIYVHLDWHVGQYAKVLLDEIFGTDNFINEIIWQKARASKSQSLYFPNVHDTIYFYVKSFEGSKFNPIYTEKSEKLLQTHYRHIDEETGKRYNLADFTQSGQGEARRFGDYGVIEPPPGKHWIWSQERIDEGMKEGLIVFSKGGKPYVKRFYEDTKGNVPTDIWTDINPVNQVAKERVDYPTQKPESLLERIITASSDEGDLILDCFCGSGTTAAVAEKLNRRWITCDLGRYAVHTTRKRLLDIEGIRPFVVQNLGKYERQAWKKAEFGERAASITQAYRSFILDLYHAEPIEGYMWLHGKKGGRMVHVGSVDSPVALGDVQQVAVEFRKAIGTGKSAPKVAGVDMLGWDFALDMNETAKQIAQEANLNVRFVRIPREVLEKRAVEQGDIQFFELAALSVDVQVKGRKVQVELNDFMVPPDDVPEDVIRAVKHWSEWIDYWAVDFNYHDDTFHNEWQSYRTRQDRKLQLSVPNTYEKPGTYTILVKVIDILGNDTTKAITVEVA